MNSSLTGYALSVEGATSELMLHHRRLGHILFSILSRLFPSLSTKCNKNLLVCDHCELAKYTRAVFPISGIRSSKPFVLIHSDVWGLCSTNTLMGNRWFVTFIDCFSRVTWVYLLKKKMKVLNCFKEFHKHVGIQFGVKIKILRSDNGTAYINQEFHAYLHTHGIIHQTICVDTPT